MFDWTPDSQRLNFRYGYPIRFGEVDVATGATSELLADPAFSLHAAKYSPDGRWIALNYAPGGTSPVGIFLVPLRNHVAAPGSEWIRIMNRRGAHTRPWWSRDGNSVYFLSDAGAGLGIWRQKLHPDTKRSDGEPTMVYQPDPETGGRITSDPQFGPGESRDALIFPVRRSTSNIWIADLPAR